MARGSRIATGGPIETIPQAGLTRRFPAREGLALLNLTVPRYVRARHIAAVITGLGQTLETGQWKAHRTRQRLAPPDPTPMSCCASLSGGIGADSANVCQDQVDVEMRQS
jgi:hypothetical protein